MVALLFTNVIHRLCVDSEGTRLVFSQTHSELCKYPPHAVYFLYLVKIRGSSNTNFSDSVGRTDTFKLDTSEARPETTSMSRAPYLEAV
ncbi:hypothetical protein AcW1_007059 [Taiwanofungus camphoratus]|nr:hypothetical protein AcV7_005121 [Antrodia cinnamomea]KAI0929635.1 hypothetical protein AcV7_005121 [Antrodia cinnamomea]KAI0955493.1 hypothetical protein AcW1_007059 [Antrodia cinnamomea]